MEIAILNLMADKIATERQLALWLGNTMLQVNLTSSPPMPMCAAFKAGRETKNTRPNISANSTAHGAISSTKNSTGWSSPASTRYSRGSATKLFGQRCRKSSIGRQPMRCLRCICVGGPSGIETIPQYRKRQRQAEILRPVRPPHRDGYDWRSLRLSRPFCGAGVAVEKPGRCCHCRLSRFRNRRFIG